MQIILMKIKTMIGGVVTMVGAVIQYLLNQLNQVAQTLSILKAYLAPFIKAESSPKQEPINVDQEVTLLGLQPQTIVPPTSQPVVTAQSLKKGKPAGSTKSAQSRTNENKIAQTLTGVQLTADGLKSQGRAKPRHQRAKPASKKGK